MLKSEEKGDWEIICATLSLKTLKFSSKEGFAGGANFPPANKNSSDDALKIELRLLVGERPKRLLEESFLSSDWLAKFLWLMRSIPYLCSSILIGGGVDGVKKRTKDEDGEWSFENGVRREWLNGWMNK